MSESVVYFVQAGDYIKIGTTTTLKSRLAAIATHVPFPIHLLSTIPGDECLEARIQRRFRKFRVHGEWFQDAPEIRLYIQSPCAEDQDSRSFPSPRLRGYRHRALPTPPAWFASLLAQHDLDLERLRVLSSIHPETVCRWASDKRLYPSTSVSGKVAKAMGLKDKELCAMRKAAFEADAAEFY